VVNTLYQGKTMRLKTQGCLVFKILYKIYKVQKCNGSIARLISWLNNFFASSYTNVLSNF